MIKYFVFVKFNFFLRLKQLDKLKGSTSITLKVDTGVIRQG